MIVVSCKKNNSTTEQSPSNLFVAGNIKSNIGGSLENGTGIKITFPAEGLPQDVDIKIGIRGDEPTTVENTKLQVIGKPFTLVLPIDTLKKTALIEFPKPTNFTSSDEIAYFAFNGKTYMPLYYQVNGNKIEVKLDVLNYVQKYNSTNARGLNPLGEIIIIGVVYSQTPPSSQMGLKEVTVGNNGKLIYSDVGTLTTNDKCIILVHGWFSNPDTWEKFIPLFLTKQNVGYTKILTFGYNSSLPINDNGNILANILSTKFQNKKVDLVGHSMGGLVARAAIENYNSSQFVRNLVTLGTPHKGSPLAALRSLMGILVATDGIPEYIAFNMNTQGFKDLYPTSTFITNLNSNPQTTAPYYAIAAENDACGSYQTYLGLNIPYCWPSSIEIILAGNDDGVVAKSSSLGIVNNNNIGLPTELFLPNFVAHIYMTQNEGFVNLVAGYLNQQSQPIPTNGLVAYLPFNGNANDFSGNNNNGTVNGATPTTDRKGNANSAYNFNTNSISIENSSTLNFTTTSTWSFWINTNSTSSTAQCVWAKDGDISSRLNSFISVNSDQTINTWISQLTGNSPFIVPNSNYQNWIHLVYVFDQVNSNFKIYSNGILIKNQALTFSHNNINGYKLYIGYNNVSGFPWYFKGKIDDFRVYNRLLNQNEILSLKNE